MSMPIQRQSEAYGIFDDGPRYARDRASTDLPRGLAGLLNSTGPRIQAGLLNTRQAGVWDDHPEEYGLGFDEAYEEPRGAVGMTYDDDPDSPRSVAYDRGRAHGQATYYNENPDEDPGSFSFHTQRAQPFEEGTSFKEAPHLDMARRSRGEHWPGHRSSSRQAGWHTPDYDPRVDGYADDYGDRPSAADFAEEDAENERRRNYPRGQGAPWDYDTYGDPDPDLESLENTADPERFISGNRRASRRPFDRAAARRLAKDGECTCWEGYERVPGTEPCASRSCRKKTSARRFLAFDWKPYFAASPTVEGHHARLENGHTLSVHQDHSKPHQGWSWSVTVPKGTIYDADGGNPQQMLELVTGGGKNWEGIHGAYATHHLPTREHAIEQAQEAYQTLYPIGTDTGGHDSGVDYSDLNSYMRHLEGRRVVALAPAAVDPTMTVPTGGGFQPAHRVGLDWRDSTVPGTVIGVDDRVHVRWDDGQYTSEDPTEVHLL